MINVAVIYNQLHTASFDTFWARMCVKKGFLESCIEFDVDVILFQDKVGYTPNLFIIESLIQSLYKLYKSEPFLMDKKLQ